MKQAKKPEKSVQKTNPGKRAKIEQPKKGVSEEDRNNMIREAAYFYAQQRNFEKGGSVQDWLNAESDINNQLGN